MIFNTIANGTILEKNRQINRNPSLYFGNKIGMLSESNIRREGHVTFIDNNRHTEQVLYPKRKPKYNFTYGQPPSKYSIEQSRNV